MATVRVSPLEEDGTSSVSGVDFLPGHMPGVQTSRFYKRRSETTKSSQSLSDRMKGCGLRSGSVSGSDHRAQLNPGSSEDRSNLIYTHVFPPVNVISTCLFYSRATLLYPQCPSYLLNALILPASMKMFLQCTLSKNRNKVPLVKRNEITSVTEKPDE